MDIGIEIPRQARPKRKGSVIAGLATAAVIAAGLAAPLHATILENVQRDELIAKIAAAPQENLPPGRSPSRNAIEQRADEIISRQSDIEQKFRSLGLPPELVMAGFLLTFGLNGGRAEETAPQTGQPFPFRAV